MHQELPKDPDQYAGIFPVIRSGKQDELKMICDDLGIANLSNHDASWVKTDIENNTIIWENNQISDSRVPDVRGMTLRDAIYVLENLGLKVEVSGRGRVSQQSVLPGSKFNQGNEIKLELSS